MILLAPVQRHGWFHEDKEALKGLRKGPLHILNEHTLQDHTLKVLLVLPSGSTADSRDLLARRVEKVLQVLFTTVKQLQARFVRQSRLRTA